MFLIFYLSNIYSTFAPANSEKPMHFVNVVRSDEGGRRWQDVIAQHSSKQTNMYLNKEKKAEIFAQYGKNGAQDTGSVESQVALFSYRIKHLTEHLKKNHKDNNTARSLTMLVGKRRKLLSYLKERDIERYRNLIKALGLRR